MSVEGLRERKKLDTRRRIEAAALDRFERDGFEATTVDDIAAAADIAPRTFFHYFATKEDVVLADYATRLGRITTTLDEQPDSESLWSALRRAFVVVAADYQTEQSQLLRRFRITADTPSVFARSLQLQAGWEDAVADALTQRMGLDPDPDITPRLLAAAALAAMRASLRQWLADGGVNPLPQYVTESFDRLARGLGEGQRSQRFDSGPES